MRNRNYQLPEFSFLQKNKHISTVWPLFFRSVNIQVNEELFFRTSKNDTIEIDCYNHQQHKAVVIFHGLESSSKNIQIRGLAKRFCDENFDVYCPNLIGCGKSKNTTSQTYHAGDTDQIAFILNSIFSKYSYDHIGIIGVSLGANMILNFLAKEKNNRINFAIAISPPLEMSKAVDKIDGHFFYRPYFLRAYRKKLTSNKNIWLSLSNPKIFKKEITSLRAFDEKVTAQLYGFKDGETYYNLSSPINVLNEIKIPTLVLSARNDPFLPKECYPETELNSFLTFDYPEYGGHVGYLLKNNTYYHEEKSIKFAKNIILRLKKPESPPAVKSSR